MVRVNAPGAGAPHPEKGGAAGKAFPEDRTECVGTCIVCDPQCPVHALRAEERRQADTATPPKNRSTTRGR